MWANCLKLSNNDINRFHYRFGVEKSFLTYVKLNFPIKQNYSWLLKLLKYPSCSVAEILSKEKPVWYFPNHEKPHVLKVKNFQIFQKTNNKERILLKSQKP